MQVNSNFWIYFQWLTCLWFFSETWKRIFSKTKFMHPIPFLVDYPIYVLRYFTDRYRTIRGTEYIKITTNILYLVVQWQQETKSMSHSETWLLIIMEGIINLTYIHKGQIHNQLQITQLYDGLALIGFVTNGVVEFLQWVWTCIKIRINSTI